MMLGKIPSDECRLIDLFSFFFSLAVKQWPDFLTESSLEHVSASASEYDSGSATSRFSGGGSGSIASLGCSMSTFVSFDSDEIPLSTF